jgi:cyclopropane fatty-acyl-phospholipid synthase-like methyltransferase
VKVVEVLGKEKAIEIFKETKNIEEDGGMMVLVCILTYFCSEIFIFYLFKCMALIKLMIMWILKFVNRTIFRKV